MENTILDGETWYLMNETGACVYVGTEDEMFEILLKRVDDEDWLTGPWRELSPNEGGGFELHPKGIR